ncbi:hypothetical protein L6452_25561 [Arctium lappa]|uniref:Uncharacterized protein n=1 Tax=Arctium lappa TaxID=4217 RepID=A0ACB9AFL8_ARCLA|nr:hypothetical protein L6452_25561 [Arctium lappa]
MMMEDKGEESVISESKSEKTETTTLNSYWLINFSRDLMATAFMGGIVHSIDLYRSILRNGNSQTSNNFFSGSSANFIDGAAAGCTTLVIIYPLDIAHTRLAANLGRTESRQFQGIPHFLSTV